MCASARRLFTLNRKGRQTDTLVARAGEEAVFFFFFYLLIVVFFVFFLLHCIAERMHFLLFLDNIAHFWGWEIIGLGGGSVAARVWSFTFQCFGWRGVKMMEPELRFLEVRCQYALIYRNHNTAGLMEGVERVLWCGPSAEAEYFKQKHPKVSFIAGESMEKSDVRVLL